MRDTIDKRVSEVLKKENQKLSAEHKTIQKMIAEIEKIAGNMSDNYTIAPKDTIGKSVRYNTGRR
ncbi:hypothetical protein SAMN05421636_101586 [Pricia antarctica]|uniref:Uncharacterized protein n=1 Tax=Pricia antarctica TaxID=641691 RepID=A0A1G6X9V6_9FLAO|nr:hypothetical protein [Pricia antarctica]SDD74888.1 hypothetical protein SAMN05421636_101586 [Pricia antarctica]